jgi:hypothetical protein
MGGNSYKLYDETTPEAERTTSLADLYGSLVGDGAAASDGGIG